MGTFEISRVVKATPEQVWRVVTDWGGYVRWMPLTKIRQDPGETRVGWSFAGLTGVGRLRFSDSMVLTDWSPPVQGSGTFRLVKTGRLLGGWAQVRVSPAADPGGAPGTRATRLDWRERITVRPAPLGALVDPVLSPLNKRLFTSVIAAMAAEAEQGPTR